MFLCSPKADNGDRSPYGNFWFGPTPSRFGAADARGDKALQLTAVYACVRVIADAVSSAPFKVYKTAPDGSRKEIKTHWLYRLIASRPNDFQNPMEFREMMTGHLELRGNAFAQIIANGKGEVTALLPIHPDMVTVEVLRSDTDMNWRYRIKLANADDLVLARTDMLHIKGMSGNGIMGYSPIQLAAKAIGSGLAAQDYGLRFFENDASPTGGVLEHPTNFKDKETRDRWREAWQEQQGGRNKGKIAVLEYGMKYSPGITVKNTDAQFLESRQYTRSEIATMWGVPPHMIGDLSKATFSNIEQQSIDFVNNALEPRLNRWASALAYNFLDPDDLTISCEFSTTALLRGDAAARSTYYNNGTLGGWLTRNEARAAEGLNRIEGLDEPLRPLNMIADTAAEEEDQEIEATTALPPNVTPNVPPAPAPAQPDKGDARLLALSVAASERVARKEVEAVAKALKFPNDQQGAQLIAVYERHAAFVSAALSVSMASAQAYCAEQIELAQVFAVDSPEEFSDIVRSKLERLAIQG
ncbi:phage portal protein [Rugamonas sp.]|uniref:phage portal protein n=1 Tax=Rugamonas sp. TaxID=1926287 RepID=UPI0025D58366|nr:phage portal protein [Rugamonas sp.]